jgi:competence protein ComEA
VQRWGEATAVSSAPANFHVTVIGLAALVVVGGIAWFGVGLSDPAPQSVVEERTIVAPAMLTVHVSGEVVNPGLVRIEPEARLADAIAAAGGATANADLSRTNLAAIVRDGEQVVVPSYEDAHDAGASSSAGIDLNTATAVELEALPGVGPVLAGRIVSFRDERGRFSAIEDLLDVPGIGEAKLAQMRDAIAPP